MNLKEFRDFKGIQRKFIVRQTGISSKHINDIEAGRVNLTEKMANKLASFYKIDTLDIKKMYTEGINNDNSVSCK